MIDDGKTFLDSDSDTKVEKKGIINYYEDIDYDDSGDEKVKKVNYSTMSLSELIAHIKTSKNVKGKAVEACITQITKNLLKEKYQDVIIKNGVVLDPVKKRGYFVVKGKKLKKSVGSILFYKTLNKSETINYDEYKFYVVLYNYSSYIEKKSKEFECVKDFLKSNSIEIRLLSDLVK